MLGYKASYKKYYYKQCVKEIIKLINLINFKIIISWFDYNYGFLKDLIWFDLLIN
jgi:hypothetical protein